MKRVLIIGFLVSFLLPGFASADGYYCVKFPTEGNSMWSTKDNGGVSVRFQYLYKIINEKGTLKGKYSVNGNLVGNHGDPLEYDVDRSWHDFGSRDLCLNFDVLSEGLQWFVDNATKEDFGVSFPDNSVATITGVYLDIQHGYDCPKLAPTADNIFEIYRRTGDHVKPWGCKRVK